MDREQVREQSRDSPFVPPLARDESTSRTPLAGEYEALAGQLTDTWKELHTHLREAHKKRDQLLAFYITLLAATFAFRNVQRRTGDVAFGLTVFGWAVLWA
jgi:hypothetical protein